MERVPLHHRNKSPPRELTFYNARLDLNSNLVRKPEGRPNRLVSSAELGGLRGNARRPLVSCSFDLPVECGERALDTVDLRRFKIRFATLLAHPRGHSVPSNVITIPIDVERSVRALHLTSTMDALHDQSSPR